MDELERNGNREVDEMLKPTNLYQYIFAPIALVMLGLSIYFASEGKVFYAAMLLFVSISTTNALLLGAFSLEKFDKEERKKRTNKLVAMNLIAFFLIVGYLILVDPTSLCEDPIFSKDIDCSEKTVRSQCKNPGNNPIRCQIEDKITDHMRKTCCGRT
ncbi:MAG: hypothetical protein ABH950_01805 [Candidatus Altiarchaeota archaeon]